MAQIIVRQHFGKQSLTPTVAALAYGAVSRSLDESRDYWYQIKKLTIELSFFRPSPDGRRSAHVPEGVISVNLTISLRHAAVRVTSQRYLNGPNKVTEYDIQNAISFAWETSLKKERECTKRCRKAQEEIRQTISHLNQVRDQTKWS